MWTRFSMALSFLTVLRVPFAREREPRPEDLARSFGAYPLVGLLLGFFSWAVAAGLTPVMPHLALAVLLTILAAGLTRFFHLDGLADCADGLLGGHTANRRLEIMKDSRSGAFGVVAVCLALMLRAACLDAILQGGALMALVAVPALSRFAIVLTAWKIPYARKTGGLGRPFLENLDGPTVAGAAILAAAVALLTTPTLAFPFGLTVLVIVAGARHIGNRLLGGITGDVLGAVNEVTEPVLFLIAACIGT